MDLGIWCYGFLICTVFTGILLGSAVFALFLVIVAVILVVVSVFALIAGACGEGGGGGGGGGGDCNFDCGICNALNDCSTAGVGPGPGPGPIGTNFYFYTGPSTSGGECCPGSGCTGLCLLLPFFWTIAHMPQYPANVWGGLLGLTMGTHPARLTYSGGNCLKDSLSFRTSSDDELRNDSNWRVNLYDYLYESGNIAPAAVVAPSQETMDGWWARGRQPSQDTTSALLFRDNGNTRVHYKSTPFEAADNIQPNSYEDYTANNCWICRDTSTASWQKWIGCGHAFCSVCSDKMLKRKMPCPLCRTGTFEVLEAPPCRRQSGVLT
jgi:hypothetical protein